MFLHAPLKVLSDFLGCLFGRIEYLETSLIFKFDFDLAEQQEKGAFYSALLVLKCRFGKIHVLSALIRFPTCKNMSRLESAVLLRC